MRRRGPSDTGKRKRGRRHASGRSLMGSSVSLGVFGSWPGYFRKKRSRVCPRRTCDVVAAEAHSMIGRPAGYLLSDDTAAGRTSDKALHFNWLTSVTF